MKATFAILVGVGVTDLVALNAWVAPKMLDGGTRAIAPAPKIAPDAERVAAIPEPRPKPEPTPEPAAEPKTETVAAAPIAVPETETATETAAPAAAPIPVAETATEPGAADLTLSGPTVLYFALDRATIYPATAATLSNVAATLTAHPELTLTITAHACASGSSDHNLSLSARRARRVIEHLASLGVDADRMQPVARGERDAHPDLPEAREDRRVDLAFVERAP